MSDAEMDEAVGTVSDWVRKHLADAPGFALDWDNPPVAVGVKDGWMHYEPGDCLFITVARKTHAPSRPSPQAGPGAGEHADDADGRL